MKRLHSILFAATATAALILSQPFTRQGRVQSNSGGAPVETSCNSCHSGSALNNSNGSLSLSIAGNPQGYTPGQSYDITITQTYTGRSRFGFAFSAKQQSSGQPQGTLSNAGTGAQILTGNYATHTVTGTGGTNSKTWTVRWTAPATAVGPIELVAWGNASNNNSNWDGDLIYTATKVLGPASAAEPVAETAMHVFPVPARNRIHIQLLENMAMSASLYSLKGERIVLEQAAVSGTGIHTFSIPGSCAPGVYVLEVTSGSSVHRQKLLVD